MVKQIIPFVKDKLDNDIIFSLLSNTPKEHWDNMKDLLLKYKKD